MNYKVLSHFLGLLLLPVGAAMLGCFVFSVADWQYEQSTGAARSLAISALVTLIFGGILVLLGRGSADSLLRKEAIALVGIAWLLVAFFGALPYFLVENPLNFAEAYFESMSGFTTTGSSVLSDVTAWPRSIILWRALTQWLGGGGILVLFVALLSTMGAGASRSLFKQESSVSANAGFATRAKDRAMRLWQIYLGLSVICFAGLLLMGMGPFDAAVHTFATVSTGGFSSRNESIAAYASPMIEIWITLFMILGGISFVLLAWLAARRWEFWKVEEEAKSYLWILGGASLLITADLVSWSKFEGGMLEALRQSTFQVVSIMTTTGFATADFNQWPLFSKMILVAIMFIGGCAGSTSGGIKVRRILVFLKMTRQQIIAAFRPNQVFALKLNGMPLNSEMRNQVLFFIALTGLVVAVFTMLVGLFEYNLDLVSCFTAVVATLFNIGPGLNAVGPMSNFGDLTAASHILLSVAMALGRLEFFAILVLFLPELWRKY